MKIENLFELGGLVSKCGKYNLCGCYGKQFINIYELNEKPRWVKQLSIKTMKFNEIENELLKYNFEPIKITRQYGDFNICRFCKDFEKCILDKNGKMSKQIFKQIMSQSEMNCFEPVYVIKKLIKIKA
ncbi:MAG: hypothetical protein ACRC7W_07080 [Fusobacteriaceae bacterium]